MINKNTATLVVIVCLFAQCKKNSIADSNSLLPAAQDGKNIIGLLLSGQPWTPKGNNGTANLSIDFDEGVNNGVFSLSSYRIITSTNREYFGIGLKDSVNFITAPKTFTLGNNTLFGVFFSNNNCTFDYFDSTVDRRGSLTITKLDRTNRIISGTFGATLIKAQCKDIKITEGRFDMKF